MIRETLRMRWLALPLALLMPFGAADAQIALSDLVVELHPGKDSRQDVEVANNGSDRAFVAIEPAEIVNPGTSAETRRPDPDPEKLGLLVSPSRMILEAGQRKLIRFADIEPASDRERVYRVTVKPVVGEIAKEQSGLKLLIGYDVLVLARPAQPHSDIVFTRSADGGIFRNDGNVSVELASGRQCDASGKSCSELPGKRLYAGAQWSVQLKSGMHAEFDVKSPTETVHKTF